MQFYDLMSRNSSPLCVTDCCYKRAQYLITQKP